MKHEHAVFSYVQSVCKNILTYRTAETRYEIMTAIKEIQKYSIFEKF